MSYDTTLIFQLYTARDALPVEGARVTIIDPQTNEQRTQFTNSSGKTQPLSLKAPDVAISLDPYATELPYRRYDALVEADGYRNIKLEGIQVFSGQEAIASLEMNPQVGRAREETIVIPENGLLVPRTRTPDAPELEPRILKEVFVPAYITVHLGKPNDRTAKNVSVSFPDYIKNVASSEIYPTWPENALRANILAQISFAQNRIFTEWYRSQGYNFDITNNTNYDQYFVYQRNIYKSVSRIVDDLFTRYVRTIGTINPLFTEYCNGTTVTCKGLSQWGTVPLAQNGYTPLGILKYYYGNRIEIAAANPTRAIGSSYPGQPLKVGTVSPDVQTVKTQLNRVRVNYSAIPPISQMDNRYTAETAASVRTFQRIFNLAPDGIVGRATWNRLSYIYTAVKKLAELGGEGVTLPQNRPVVYLQKGSQGENVKLAQYFLRVISQYYEAIRPIDIDGIFGSGTETAVKSFQRMRGLRPDGVIGPDTWEALYESYFAVTRSSGLAVPYPGYLLQVGSRGDNVKLMQQYLNAISNVYPQPPITADGIYGERTASAVRSFQRLTGLTPDGIIGSVTWGRIVAVRLLIR